MDVTITMVSNGALDDGSESHISVPEVLLVFLRAMWNADPDCLHAERLYNEIRAVVEVDVSGVATLFLEAEPPEELSGPSSNLSMTYKPGKGRSVTIHNKIGDISLTFTYVGDTASMELSGPYAIVVRLASGITKANPCWQIPGQDAMFPMSALAAVNQLLQRRK